MWTASVPLSAQRSQSPAVMPVVLAVGSTGYRTEAPVVGQWPAAASVAAVSPALEAALRANAAAAGGAGGAGTAGASGRQAARCQSDSWRPSWARCWAGSS